MFCTCRGRKTAHTNDMLTVWASSPLASTARHPRFLYPTCQREVEFYREGSGKGGGLGSAAGEELAPAAAGVNVQAGAGQAYYQNGGLVPTCHLRLDKAK